MTKQHFTLEGTSWLSRPYFPLTHTKPIKKPRAFRKVSQLVNIAEIRSESSCINSESGAPSTTIYRCYSLSSTAILQRVERRFKVSIQWLCTKVSKIPSNFKDGTGPSAHFQAPKGESFIFTGTALQRICVIYILSSQLF